MGQSYDKIGKFVEDYKALSRLYPEYVIPAAVAMTVILVLLLVLALKREAGRKDAEEMDEQVGGEGMEPEAAVLGELEFEEGFSIGIEGSQEAAVEGVESVETVEEVVPPEAAPAEALGEEPEREVVGDGGSASEVVDKAAPMDEGGREGFMTPLEEEFEAVPEEEELEAQPVYDETEPEVEETEQSLFARLRAGLSRTQSGLLGKLGEMVALKKEIDEGLWNDFEEALVMADMGIGTTMKLRTQVEQSLTKAGRRDSGSIVAALREEILAMLKNAEGAPVELDGGPLVIMVAGVNGVGKTTTIGKLAYMFAKDGKKVMVAAADTFRAAAVEQLEIWARRVGSDFLKGQSGADPSAVAYDAVKAALARGTDVLIIDTAGRLHTKTNLMEELKKIKRVVGREMGGAPHETLLVLDATTGQNAVQQAKVFKDSIEVTGIVLTKLDGTAKGGVIVAIADELNIPVKFIGIGESLTDLRRFHAEDFVEALFLTGEETIH